MFKITESTVILGIENKKAYNIRHAGHHSPAKNGTNKITLQKPLQTTEFRPTFRGFNISAAQNAVKPLVEAIPADLTRKVFESLKKISKKQYEEYKEIADNYVNLVKTSPEFRKKFGFSDEIAQKISADNLFYRPQKNILQRFMDNLISPFTAAGKGIKKLFAKHLSHY